MIKGYGIFMTGVMTVCVASLVSRADDGIRVMSPDRAVVVTVNTQGILSYEVTVDSKPVLARSRLGLVFSDGLSLGESVKVAKVVRSKHRGFWENHFGKTLRVEDCWNEGRVELVEQGPRPVQYRLIVRAYDDGIALRYDLPKQDGFGDFTVVTDRTEFAFHEDGRAIGGEWSDCGEMNYPETRLSALPQSKMCLPIVVQTPAAVVAIAESDVRDWACSFLKRSDRLTLCADLASKVVSSAPRVSPWHLMMVGRKAGDLIESSLMVNLAAPSRIGDDSWIQPGLMAWDKWWSMDGYGNTASDKRYIDLASEMGWPYMLVDWGWCNPIMPGPMPFDPAAELIHNPGRIDLPGLFEYAKQKHVGLFLWMNHNNVNRIGIEKSLATCARWGAAGVKIDFMNRSDQEMVKWYETVLACAAKYRLMVNFHGAYVPTGLARTWPNYITQEGVLGNEHNKWGGGKPCRCNIKHHITLPFTRCLLGPADFTPGGFLNRRATDWRGGSPTFVMGTRARQLALTAVIDSPLLCLADSPENYRDQPGLEFLRGLPTVWDETHVLSADLAEHLVEARRQGGTWYIAAMNNDKPLALKVPLDFLGSGKFTINLYRDTAESETVATSIAVETRTVTRTDVLDISMVVGGGFAAKVERSK